VRTIITTLALALVMAGCGSHKPLEQPPQGVQAQTIDHQGSVGGAGLRFSAIVTPDSEVPLAFRIPGYVISLKQVRGQDGRMRDIAEGDRVSRGAVLVRIRSSEYEDKVHQASSQAAAAEAVFQKAKLDFDRATHLYDTQSLTKPDFDSARAQYDSSEEQLKSARALTSEAEIALHDTSLIAPFDSDIVKKSVELGAFVGPGVPAFALAKTDTVKIVVGVPDTVVRSIKVGQLVEVAIDAFPARTFHARISRMSSAADTITRNFEVEVAIPNRDHLLKVGMIGSLQLAHAETKAESCVAGSAFRNRASERRQIWRVRCFKLEFRRASSPPQCGNRLCHWNRHNRTQWANPRAIASSPLAPICLRMGSLSRSFNESRQPQ
jgi:RND family efflux transporter MFP subunit